ncbi:hypothetical protein UFOVP116_40 [uncultured Caudovirales phage]|uniref:Uncharacterized protein n=1 Tax=uncultured Caudovirales phage TaxID=2100421 RepID=A0A6J5L9M4_9CAUD|nr:hypothetical protein UFOVP116_40 [uncultured Caudovirales phage]
MRIYEILNSTRKIIKAINRAYIECVLDPDRFDDLHAVVYAHDSTNDPDLRRELDRVKTILAAKIQEILTADYPK